ncbi:SgcJ/EcaC family oxidoreductase [Planobispora rosea]|uniref:SgcJ/EcaC family oxidoreductase n=1 Tax=Planobispora rosea TaxID=35762 RepID=UPI00083A02CC|nr:SgcJ/EcaC family oxidoreductase [Planobispora rosea]
MADDSAVRDLYSRLLDAWNRRDARAYAALIADDGTIIGFDGSIETGGKEVEEHLAGIFADHPTASYVAKVREVRPLGPDTVLLRAISGLVPPGADDLNPAANSHHTLIAERHGDTWRIVLFQNTPAAYHGRPHLVDQHTTELRELLEEQQPRLP